MTTVPLQAWGFPPHEPPGLPGILFITAMLVGLGVAAAYLGVKEGSTGGIAVGALIAGGALVYAIVAAVAFVV